MESMTVKNITACKNIKKTRKSIVGLAHLFLGVVKVPFLWM